jgi:hypothetical protein
LSAINDKAAGILDGLEERRQAVLLAQVAHNLTVCARETYGTPADGSELLRRYNEIQHLLTAHICALLKDHERRYPSRVLFDVIVEAAGTDTVGLRLSERIEWAFNLALNQESLP